MTDLLEALGTTKTVEEKMFEKDKVKIEYVSEYDVAYSFEDRNYLCHETNMYLPAVSQKWMVKNKMLRDYIKEVLTYYKHIVEQIVDINIDRVEKVTHDRIYYEISGTKMSIDSDVVYNHFNGSSMKEQDDINETTKGKYYEDEYLQDLINATVKAAKAKEVKIIKDKLKKLIDEL